LKFFQTNSLTCLSVGFFQLIVGSLADSVGLGNIGWFGLKMYPADAPISAAPAAKANTMGPEKESASAVNAVETPEALATTPGTSTDDFFEWGTALKNQV
jgi:hypothetical protein